MKRRPRIGLTMRLEIEKRRFYLGRDYCEALESCGAVPLHLALIPKRDLIKDALEDLDGILLPGSDTDVEPERYGEEPHLKIGKIIDEKDETDLLVLEEAEKLKMPVLAICFGMQVLNVFRGGTLFQDINSQISGVLKHEQGMPLDRNSHSIEIEKQSLLFRLKVTDNVRVNSHHHQSINKIGSNLKPTAWAKDGVIEGIEETRSDRFNLGVQWHPENSWKTDLFSKNIIETFVESCAKYKQKRID